MPAFHLSRQALDFLLRQVTVGIDYSQLTNALDPSGLREVAGTNNNLVGYDVSTGTPGAYWDYGATDTAFLREAGTFYDSAPVQTAGYGTLGGNVTDASPRTASLLVTTSNANENPAAAAAVADAADIGAYTDADGTVHIPNAGVLGGGKYNDFLVAFGQFFDHGLDFVQKGASGTIAVPLSPNDPNYIDQTDPAYVPGVSNIMYVSRANLANPASDFDSNGNLLAGVAPVYNNNSASHIDQSQTYGSDPSANAFLREYTDSGTVTGRVLAGQTELGAPTSADDASASGGLATWADLKTNAARLGIHLTDQDVSKVPMLRRRRHRQAALHARPERNLEHRFGRCRTAKRQRSIRAQRRWYRRLYQPGLHHRLEPGSRSPFHGR